MCAREIDNEIEGGKKGERGKFFLSIHVAVLPVCGNSFAHTCSAGVC